MSAGSAFATDIPKEGPYGLTSCFSGVSNLIAFSKTHWASTYEHTGTNLSNSPGGMFDKTSFRCVGMNTSFGGRNTDTSVCESIDKDGDKRLSYFSLASDGKITREQVAGTGKYEGMVSSGTTTPLGPFPVMKAGTFGNCVRQTGTYKLK